MHVLKVNISRSFPRCWTGKIDSHRNCAHTINVAAVNTCCEKWIYPNSGSARIPHIQIAPNPFSSSTSLLYSWQTNAIIFMMRSRGERKHSKTTTKHFALMENSGNGIDLYSKYTHSTCNHSVERVSDRVIEREREIEGERMKRRYERAI